MRIKITTIVGTRPEIIRLSQLIQRLDGFLDHRLLHTGQNYEKNLNDIFFESMSIRQPDVKIDVNSTSLANQLGTIFEGVERELSQNRPDAVLILGDTNSGLSAIIAKRMGIPVYHIEGGNRSFDINVPEEANRKIIDHTSDFHLVYSENSRRNLISEGIPSRQIALIGSPMREVIEAQKTKINSSKILDTLNLTESKYFLISLHRQENLNRQERLKEIFNSINKLAAGFQIPVIVSTHPRVRQIIDSSEIHFHENVRLMQPFNFFDYCTLQKNARVVLSDSGSVSEEASVLGFRAITLRDSMERPEALETGIIMMSGLEFESIFQCIESIESFEGNLAGPDEYQIRYSSERVLRFILSTINQHEFWTGKR